MLSKHSNRCKRFVYVPQHNKFIWKKNCALLFLMTSYRSDYFPQLLILMSIPLMYMTTLPISPCYNNITTGTFEPFQSSTTGSHVLTCRTPLQEKQVLFLCRLPHRSFLTTLRTMSEPSKQDIAAIFKRLRSIPTNKVRILNDRRVPEITRKLVKLKLSDT